MNHLSTDGTGSLASEAEAKLLSTFLRRGTGPQRKASEREVSVRRAFFFKGDVWDGMGPSWLIGRKCRVFWDERQICRMS